MLERLFNLLLALFFPMHHHKHKKHRPATRLKIVAPSQFIVCHKGNTMHVQAKKGTTFSVTVTATTDDGKPTTNTPDGLPQTSNFDTSVVSVGSPTLVSKGVFSVPVTIVGDKGTTTIYAALGAIQGSISVTVQEEVPTDPPATKLVLTVDDAAVEVLAD